MRSLTWAAGALAVLVAASPATAQTVPPRLPAHLDVSGRGSVERMPDRVIVSFSIVTNDDVATRATSANNAAYETLAAKLRGLGIDPAAIRTTGYNLYYNPRPESPAQQYQTRYGYVVSRSVAVTSDRTDQAGRIVDAGVASGITNVGGIAFTLRDSAGAYRSALAAAVADAQAQAETLAAAAHLRLIRILALSAGSAPPVPVPAPRMLAGIANAPVPTDVPPSNLTVFANVTLSYEIAP